MGPVKAILAGEGGGRYCVMVTIKKSSTVERIILPIIGWS